LERPARHVLHDDVARVALDHRVEYADDVRVVELPGERGLIEEELLEALGFLLAHAGVAARDLHRDLAVVERVLGEVDHGGGALAELREDVVLPDLFGALEHGRSLSDEATSRVAAGRGRRAGTPPA